MKRTAKGTVIMNNTDKLYMTLMEFQTKRQALAGPQQDDAHRALMKQYKGELGQVLDTMQASITAQRSELLKAEGYLNILKRSVTDFLRFESDPAARRQLSQGIGSKKYIAKRETIADKEQCYEVLTEGTVNSDNLKAFCAVVDA